ncbi:MAG: outer membrane protein transport protein [Crocinitomicaceae bacterium]|nr:outer membrane protein transport protein [Crocinitomicaceae bacterium]
MIKKNKAIFRIIKMNFENKITGFLVFLMLLIGTCFHTYSQGYQVNLQGQKQQAMGSAGTGLITDGAGLFFNPSTVVFLDENSINAACTPTFANTTYLDRATQKSYKTISPVGTPFSFYGLFQLKEHAKLKLGIAAYTPFGSTIEWEDNWIGRFAVTKLQLKSIFIQPTISYRLADNLGIGAGLVISSGSVSLQKDIPIQYSDQTFASAELSGSATSYGVNAGIYYEPNPKLSIGINYRSKIIMKVDDGQAIFNVPSSLDTSFPDGLFSSILPLPQVISLGFGSKINSKLSFALDFNHVSWEAYDTLGFDYAQNTSSLEDTRSARNYKNIVAIRFGSSYKVGKKLTLRGGFGFSLSPVQDGYVTPETPDGTRYNFTTGLSYEYNKHFSMDFSFLYVQVRREDHNLETNLDGTFLTKVLSPGLGIIYKW